MDPLNIATIIVALIAVGGSYATQKSLNKAQAKTINITSRVKMEDEAYDRARAFDVETIEHQKEELKQLREDNNRLHEEVKALRARITRLERGLPADTSEEIHERSTDSPFSE